MNRILNISILVALSLMLFSACGKKHQGVQSSAMNAVDNSLEPATEVPDETAKPSNVEESLETKINNTTYDTYVNARFGFSCTYPSFMKKGQESDNGDGCEFTYQKISFKVWGANNALNYGVRQALSAYAANASYKLVKPGYFIASGLEDNGNIYYEKYYLKGDVWYSAYLSYPPSVEKVVTPLLTNLFPSFPKIVKTDEN